jgi:hypothetical protein
MSDKFGNGTRPGFRVRGLFVYVNAQCLSCLESRCFVSEGCDRTDDSLAVLALSVSCGLVSPINPNIRPAVPLFALHASLLIPCSPRHDLSCVGGTDGLY